MNFKLKFSFSRITHFNFIKKNFADLTTFQDFAKSKIRTRKNSERIYE